MVGGDKIRSVDEFDGIGLVVKIWYEVLDEWLGGMVNWIGNGRGIEGNRRVEWMNHRNIVK